MASLVYDSDNYFSSGLDTYTDGAGACGNGTGHKGYDYNDALALRRRNLNCTYDTCIIISCATATTYNFFPRVSVTYTDSEKMLIKCTARMRVVNMTFKGHDATSANEVAAIVMLGAFIENCTGSVDVTKLIHCDEGWVNLEWRARITGAGTGTTDVMNVKITNSSTAQNCLLLCDYWDVELLDAIQ